MLDDLFDIDDVIDSVADLLDRPNRSRPGRLAGFLTNRRARIRRWWQDRRRAAVAPEPAVYLTKKVDQPWR